MQSTILSRSPRQRAVFHLLEALTKRLLTSAGRQYTPRLDGCGIGASLTAEQVALTGHRVGAAASIIYPTKSALAPLDRIFEVSMKESDLTVCLFSRRKQTV